ncbi:hypothetical protein [Peptacetobacter sp. AB800]|uniref:hypothetical protein n=2 Tax=unclassified Peptacetobacter TaxID=2991974 RepID=UPI0039FC58DC
MKNKKIMSIGLAVVFCIAFSNLNVMALNNSSNYLEISDSELKELEEFFPEDTEFSDDEVDKRLIRLGEFTQEEIDKINAEYDKSIVPFATKVNGVNKYKTFKSNGKNYLHIYISGKTLQKIKAGANVASALGGYIPSKFLSIAVIVISVVLGTKLDGIDTRYGIILKYVEDKWNFQGATYTYRYQGWSYQTA